ncbi:hypothetical protein ACOBV9_21315 (plasmid) [Pseudoalteromonas espejiana]
MIGDLKTTTYTIEGFYDFDNNTAFTPYIKAGLGVADNSYYSAKLGGQGISAFDAFDMAMLMVIMMRMPMTTQPIYMEYWGRG